MEFSCPHKFSRLSGRNLNQPFSPVIDEGPIDVHLVLQCKVEGEIFDALVVVDVHSRCVLVRLKVLYDIGKPHRKTVVPTQRMLHHRKLHHDKRRHMDRAFAFCSSKVLNDCSFLNKLYLGLFFERELTT